MIANSTHGGSRPGSGRPPVTPGGTRPHTVTLSDAEWEYLRNVGDGNASAGLRELIDRYHGIDRHIVPKRRSGLSFEVD